MTDPTRTPLTGDAAVDALIVEAEAILEQWGQLLEEQLAAAENLLNAIAIEEEWSC
jgi:hypothetical protein